MNEATPQLFVWDAGRSVMVPVRRIVADRTYVDGKDYRLGVIEERSVNSHSHFFASLTEAWRNLPDELAERFPTPDHLRRHALIKAGYHDASEFVCKSHAEAVRLSAFVKGIDDYAVVIVKENIVRRLTAKSQSYQAMGKQAFQDSKTKVLEIVSAMIGVSTGALKTAGKDMTRRRFSEREVIETLILQGVGITCYRCKQFIMGRDCRHKLIEREHVLEIALGGVDEPENCAYSHKACHATITNGTKATTAGSSKQRIAKVARILGGKRKSGKKIASRGFSKDKRPMQSRPFSGR